MNTLAGGSDTGPVTGNAGDLGGRRGVEPSDADSGGTSHPGGSAGSWEAPAVSPLLPAGTPDHNSTLQQVGDGTSPAAAESAEEAAEQD